MSKELYIATNNGDIGGGEVMLLNIARAARLAGYRVTIVGPAQPAELVEAAQDEGFDTVVLPAKDRKSYLVQLRLWDRRYRKGLLWCNGLVPSFATSGHKKRIVHLHQFPKNSFQKMMARVACKNAITALVPSNFMLKTGIKNLEVFYNWVREVPSELVREPVDKTVRVGFIGRPSLIKGVDILAEAINSLNTSSKKIKYQLNLAGEAKHIPVEDQNIVNKSLEKLGTAYTELGWVKPETLFSQIDLLVCPSVVDEVFGLVAAEAMSARVPVLVSNAGALPEVLGVGYPWVFGKNDVVALARMIEEVASELQQKTAESQNIISDAYWRWQEEFSEEAGKNRVANLLARYSDNP